MYSWLKINYNYKITNFTRFFVSLSFCFETTVCMIVYRDQVQVSEIHNLDNLKFCRLHVVNIRAVRRISCQKFNNKQHIIKNQGKFAERRQLSMHEKPCKQK